LTDKKTIEKIIPKIKKVVIDLEGWERLEKPLPPSLLTLGHTVVSGFLQSDCDIIEVDLTSEAEKGYHIVGGLMKALNRYGNKQNPPIEFVYRYGENRTKLFIKRLG
jgi:hypothetical protein